MIVLTGPSGSGKSTLIERILKRFDDVSGYRTRRETGEKTAFYLVPIKPERDLPAAPFLTFVDHRARFFPDAFHLAAAGSVLQDSRLIILDEVGGLELTSEVIFDWLMQLKDSPALLLMVFKSDENCRRLLAKAELSPEAEDLLWARRTALLAGVGRIYDVDDAAQLLAYLADRLA